jgi:hypothetical protein
MVTLDRSTRPDRVDAIVVGIESHDAGLRFDLPGPAYDACRIWEWLTYTGVPDERITLLISPLDKHEQDISRRLERDYGRPTRAALRDAILKKRKDTDVLFVYLAGHGIEVSHEEPFFVTADTTRNTPSGLNLRAAVGYLAAEGPPLQMILVDACRTEASLSVVPRDEYPPSVTARHDQYVLHASAAGHRTRNDDATLSGVFTTHVLTALRTIDGDWWARVPEVFQRLESHLADYDQDQHPEFWERAPGRGDRVFGPTSRPATAASHTVYRIPADWDRRARAIPLDEQYAVSLDVLWCCDRRLRLAVLADGSDRGLAGQLNSVEQSVLAPSLRSLPARTWIDIDAEGGAPHESTIRPRVAAGTGTEIAIVLRWPAALKEEAAAWVTAVRRLAQAGRADQRDQACPVIVQVIGNRAFDAAVTAASVARALGLSEIAVRPSPARPTGIASDAPITGPGAADHALALVRAVAPRDWLDQLPVAGEPRAGPGETADPYAVVQDLNQAAAWGNQASEALTLCAIREFVPGLYAGLLPALAASRSDPARCTALTVAARTDAELDQWLQSDWQNPIRPGQTVPRPMIHPAVAGAVTLALIRNNRPQDEILTWSELSDPVVRRVSEHHRRWSGDDRRNAADAEFLGTSDIATVTAAIRAGMGASLTAGDIPGAAESAGCWRLLARRGLDSATARWIAGLPDELRGLLGLARAEGENDVQLSEDVSDLREALNPSLSGRGWGCGC